MTLAPEGRKLLRLEVRNAAVPIEKKPDWIKTKLRTGPEFQKLQSLVKTEGLHTVCQEAGCPNIYECWEDREATFLIGGDQCTRRCDFCLIDTGKPGELDRDEPRRVAESIRTMDLRYATITGVTRDDLPDEGAWLYAETVRQVHAQAPSDRGGDPHPGLLRPARAAAARSSTPHRRCSRTTWRRCRGSSGGSARPSPTRSRWTSSRRAGRPAWSPSRT